MAGRGPSIRLYRFTRACAATGAFGLVAAAAAMPAAAEDLLQVYRDAQRYDAVFASARYTLEAGRERIPQGRALLLPSLTLTGNARTELYQRFHGLNLLDVGANATYKHKFGLGYAAPWISLGIAAARDDYRGDIRDGRRLDIRAEIGKRFTPEFDASFGGRYDRRYGRNDEPVVPGISGNVFDLRGESVYARAGYAITDSVLLGAELSVRRGDVVATTRPDFDIFVVSDAIAADPTFGPDFFAYRLRGTTDTAKLSASWALDERSSLNVVYVEERTDAAGGIYYRSHSANLVYAWRY